MERAGLQVADIEMWRIHYAETLRCWRERFATARPDIVALYDERFCRMWEILPVDQRGGVPLGRVRRVPASAGQTRRRRFR